MKTFPTHTYAFASMTTAVAALGLWITVGSTQAGAAAATPSFAAKVVGHGPPVILIPGLSCSGAVWEGTVEHLRGRYECHVLTLAGFAGQPRIAGPFLETVRNDLASYIRSHGLRRPIVIGHSLGGFVALWLASHDADLTGPLVVLDALPFLPAVFDPGATAESTRQMAGQMRAATAVGGEAFVRSSAVSVKTMVTKPADFDRVMSWVKTTDPVAAGDAMYDLLTQDLRGDLAKIVAPALVLGTWIAFKDRSTKAEVEARMRQQYALLKDCHVVMAGNARHFIMLDDPEWFRQQLDGFLAGGSIK